MTYYQKAVSVRKALRVVRRVAKYIGTLENRFHREVSRLIDRKELVEPKSLNKMINLYSSISQQVKQLEPVIRDAVTVATT